MSTWFFDVGSVVCVIQGSDVKSLALMFVGDADADSTHRMNPLTPRCRCDLGDVSGNPPWKKFASEGGRCIVASL